MQKEQSSLSPSQLFNLAKGLMEMAASKTLQENTKGVLQYSEETLQDMVKLAYDLVEAGKTMLVTGGFSSGAKDSLDKARADLNEISKDVSAAATDASEIIGEVQKDFSTFA
jgi:translation initiation factor 2B subunit (eIF-2B alpha/beta/delta family)